MAPHQIPKPPEVTPYRSRAPRRYLALALCAALSFLLALSILAPFHLAGPTWHIACVRFSFKLAWTEPREVDPSMAESAFVRRAFAEPPFATTIERSPGETYLSIPIVMGFLLPLFVLTVPLPGPRPRPSSNAR